MGIKSDAFGYPASPQQSVFDWWTQETLSHSSDAASLTTNAPKALDAFRNDPWVFGASRHLHSLESAFASHSFGVHNLETGIKVLDLSAPYKKGGKVGLFGGAGVGKTGYLAR